MDVEFSSLPVFELLARFFLLETSSQCEALFIGWMMTAVVPLFLAGG